MPLQRSAEKQRVPILFASVLFLNALLLFWVQPLFAKMVLPILGGSPSVWTTCMLFFQTLLLGGYAYAHFSTTRLKPKNQAILHIVLLIVALALTSCAMPSCSISRAKKIPLAPMRE